MSALEDMSPSGAHEIGGPERITTWRQPVAVPAYLVALAAGELESKEISSRVKVWAEPSVVSAAAFEFSQTEDFLSAAESIIGGYVWTRYDVLCLPPSFPYGGMENPCLTFATPTLLAGDKSLADVIAHEIAHSWTGNLVTNCTWEHFWLNEGWTVWLERKIMAKVRGSGDVALLSSQIGWKALTDSVTQLSSSPSSAPFSALVWPLGEEDPDDAFSSVPYEKGFNLLNHLEQLVGSGPFLAFARAYIDHFKNDGVSSGQFKDLFLQSFPSAPALDWDTLFYSTGLPSPAPDFSNNLSERALQLADQWVEWWREGVEGSWHGSSADMEGWSSQQKCVFLERLQFFSSANGPFPIRVLETLDLVYGLSTVGNSEIKFRWQILCLDCEAPWIVPHVIAFLKSQGRMKFVRPLYRALYNSAVGCALAKDTFVKYNESYHPIARKMIASDLKIPLSDLSPSPSSCPPAPPLQQDPFPPIAPNTPLPPLSSTAVWIIPAVAVLAAGVLVALVINKRN